MTRYRQLEKVDMSTLSLVPLSKPPKPIVMNNRIQITINDIVYLVDNNDPVIGATAHIRNQETGSFIPAAVINVERLLINEEWLKADLNRMDSKDDVFNLGFSHIILFNCSTEKV